MSDVIFLARYRAAVKVAKQSLDDWAADAESDGLDAPDPAERQEREAALKSAQSDMEDAIDAVG